MPERNVIRNFQPNCGCFRPLVSIFVLDMKYPLRLTERVRLDGPWPAALEEEKVTVIVEEGE